MNDSLTAVRLVFSMAIAILLALALALYRESVERPTEPESIAFATEVEWEVE